MLRLGIDVGGTNTDVALLEGAKVVGFAKVPTSPDVLAGVENGITQVLKSTGCGVARVQAVMLGTTHFVNALVQRKGLATVYVLRLCGPATQLLPPFVDMPIAFKDGLAGGYEYTGRDEISALCGSDIDIAVESIISLRSESVVVCGVFSPVNPAQEVAVAASLRQRLQIRGLSRVHITLSHEVGQLGLLERENAAILNAALQPLAARLVPATQAALARLGLHAPLFITANDGTLLPAHAAEKSGPVNSVRGAVFLSGLTDGLVLDIGGTTADVGVAINGLPRTAGKHVSMCGIRTNFRMPDVHSIGLGGGSHVHWVPGERAPAADASGTMPQCTVGPMSVGHELLSRALVVGGDVCTATDVAVSLGRMHLEGVTPVPTGLTQEQLHSAWQVMQGMLADAVDSMKSGREAVPVVVVGGAAALCADNLPGASMVLRPQFAEVANAVGAAVPQVSGLVEGVYELGLRGELRQEVVQKLVERAVALAVASGAVEQGCQVVEREEVPLAYMTGGAARMRVRVVGELSLGSSQRAATQAQDDAQTMPRSSQHPFQDGAGAVEAVNTGQQHGGPPVTATEPAAGQVQDEVQPTIRRSQVAGLDAPVDTGQHGTGKPTPDAGGSQAAAAAVDTEQQGTGGAPPAEAVSQAAAATQLVWASAVAAPSLAFSTETPEVMSDDVLGELRPESRQVNARGEWELRAADLEAIAVGAQILGTGGGGSAHHAKLMVLAEMDRGRVVGVVSVEDLPDDALVVDCGGMGAPTVSCEKLSAGEDEAAVQALTQHLGRQPSALLCAEVGGGNCLAPMVVGARLGLPVVDADLMGRAFPELQMMTSCIYGVPITPAAIADEKGNALVMPWAASNQWVERVMRAACESMGATVGVATSPMHKTTLDRVAIKGSISLAWRLGAAVLQAQRSKRDPVAAVPMAYGRGRLLFVGKVVDVVRVTSAGFVRGSLAMEGLGSFRGQNLEIEFQNEFLVATVAGVRVAAVPDLICCLDTSGGHAVATEELRYGLRLSVVMLPAHPLLCTSKALAVVGPTAFGYDA